MENPIKMDDLGGKPTIFGNIHIETWAEKPGLFFFFRLACILLPYMIQVWQAPPHPPAM